VGDDMDWLPPDAQERLERFGRALERLSVEDLQLYSVRQHEPDHGRAVAGAAAAATEAGLDDEIDGAREAIVSYLGRAYGNAQLRTSWIGLNSAPSLGPTADRVRVLRSAGEAVSAIVLWERLDDADRAELLGAWANLID
jgi:hypothetical protein